MFTRIAHICLKTNDLEACRHFYTQVLGMDPVFRFNRKGKLFGFYFGVGNATFIEVFLNAEPVAMRSTGLDHFCLQTEDIDAVIERFASVGLAHSPKTLGVDQTWQIWVKDPDGHRIEIQEYTAVSSQFTGEDVEATW